MKRRIVNDSTVMHNKKNGMVHDAKKTSVEAMEEEGLPKHDMQDSSKTSSSLTSSSYNTSMEASEEDNDSYGYSDDEYSYASSNDDDDDNEMSQRASVVVPSGSYCFCSKEQVKQFMEVSVKQMSDLLCIPPEATIILLRNYQWDEKKLTDDYFASSSNLQEFHTKNGILNRCSSDSTTKQPSSGCCAICMDSELNADDLFSMSCGHEFCVDCWTGYIEEALSRGKQCVFMQCPEAECKENVTSIEVDKLTPSLLSKFQYFELRSYIESNIKMRYCPGKACEFVAVGSSAEGLLGDGQCTDCGMKFCLECGEVQHVPASCQMMAVWETKCQDESETANWMLAKTKKCPNCDTRINKNGGCNHMTCSQCKYHFCWQCMQAWSVHGYERSCNQFDLQQAQSKDTTRADAERELERYLFCFRRFQNHAQGQDFAQTSLDKFEETLEENEQADSSFAWDDLKSALRQLVECRRVLKYTYVVTYSLADQPLQRGLFEDHQGLLERFTEMLSEISEKPHQDIDRTKLVNLTGTVEKYTKGVMDCQLDGGNGEL